MNDGIMQVRVEERLGKDIVVEASTMGLPPGQIPRKIVDLVDDKGKHLRRFYNRTTASNGDDVMGWTYVDGYGNTLTIVND